MSMYFLLREYEEVVKKQEASEDPKKVFEEFVEEVNKMTRKEVGMLEAFDKMHEKDGTRVNP